MLPSLPHGSSRFQKQKCRASQSFFCRSKIWISQAILMPYLLDLQVQLCGASCREFSDLEYFLAENDEKWSLYSPFNFENSFFATPSFITWWLKYYKSQHERILVCKEILVANLPNVSLQKKAASTKTKGTDVWEILQFKHYFKVKYNPRAVLTMVWDAMDVFKRKKEQHEGRCWRAFEKAKSINLFAR